jgi:phospholipid transport system substrate-binding protein
MMHRRHFLTFVAASAALSASYPAQAQVAEKAAAFIKSTGDKIVGVVNGPGTPGSKRAAMTQIVDSYVDVDEIGRFCLGRYWRQATPEQQKQYLKLFREVLVTNISAKVGEYQGVRFTMGRSRLEDEDVVVSTVVERPNNPPANVDWLVANPGSNPKIIDVKAEGTSLRLTQRQDYASYLAHNGSNIDALITAMRNQVSQSS